MPAPIDPSVYNDLQGLARLKGQAHADPHSQSALRAAAEQFESIFTRMMLKSMRATSFNKDGLFNSQQMQTYRDMLDQQLSITLSKGHGIGLADQLVRQLQGLVPGGKAASATDPVKPAGAAGRPQASNWRPESPRDFVRELWPHAKKAAADLGVSPRVLVAQAALETGWGQHAMCRADGGHSYNLFGIKAGGGWNGESVAADSNEFEDGRMVSRRSDFRAYDSLAGGMRGYVDFLNHNPRYRAALASNDDAGFVRGLQAAGYATDPAYADKVLQVADSDTMRTALAGLKDPAGGSL